MDEQRDAKEKPETFSYLTLKENPPSMVIHGARMGEGGYDYEIPLERWTDAGKVLSDLIDLSKRTWMRPEGLKELLYAVDYLSWKHQGCSADLLFRSYGRIEKIHWPAKSGLPRDPG